MKLQSNLMKRSWAGLMAAGAVLLTVGFAASHARAAEWNKRTVLTINQPMQVENTYLTPGSYVFKLVDSSSDRHIVQIFNADESHVLATYLAIPDYRVQPTGHSKFTMWETPSGYVAALRSWYYPGDNFGQEFTYPKHLRQVEVAQVTPPPPPPAPAEAAPAPAPQPQQAQVEEQQTVIAQNSEPAPPPAAQPAPAPTPAPAPAAPALPQTASPYPLIGFLGIFLIGVGGLLRQTRSA